ncbi:MAG: SulP family inorganic anion transporter, partial [Bacteroidota bacterium]|nr:SulP family inorganic anion transporter [Bacteroidota bacterium]
MIWKDAISNLRKSGRSDLLAGFVVSLVALPLSLGLALASNVPPLAGMMAALSGGIVMALFGGSHVTISGPGNSLVVVTLMGVSLLGGGDLLAGYYFTLAAVVLSGILIFLAGLLRFGGLSDFFPSSAVQGMLAAIGIIIMTKQIHIMLGEMNPDGEETIGHLMNLPETFWEVVTGKFGPWVVGTGLGSLAILVFYPRIRNSYVQAIPAPMWVVVISILISYIFEWNDVDHPIPASYLVNVPEAPLSHLPIPNFTKIQDWIFWEVVFSLFLIATIESLLSIKGMDRLDPLQRRSNTNKDLRSLGIANVVSGMLGGLNVVVVIARSSVNVTNGARTRWSNFFHGAIILLFLLLFRDLLVRIPLPALAAILVYTGWQLTRPEKFMKVYEVGWDQLSIFIVTLVATLMTNLIMGITIGILLTLFLQLYLSRSPEIILRNLFKPNAMLLQEGDGTYLLSVKNFCNFLNYQSLKKRLESIPPKARVIVDFSLADFVDFSVMEHLNGFQKTFVGRGGSLEIIGLDNLATRSDHPLSAWYPAKATHKQRHHQILTDRQREILGVFADTEVLFQPGLMINPPELSRFSYF